jgi:riboflavin synthase
VAERDEGGAGLREVVRDCRTGLRGYPRRVFTGIVREVGRVEAVEGGQGGVRLLVRAPETAAATAVGDSVAVSGVCLTAVAVEDGTVAFDAIPETLRRSSLGRAEAGTAVNVEPALRAGEPLGGHLVQGHVDGVGRVRALEAEGDGRRLEIDASPDLTRYVVEKGSVAVEGVSLTVADLDDEGFAIALVPHTLAATTLGALAAGDEVNLEVDVLAKYVERLLGSRA